MLTGVSEVFVTQPRLSLPSEPCKGAHLWFLGRSESLHHIPTCADCKFSPKEKGDSSSPFLGGSTRTAKNHREEGISTGVKGWEQVVLLCLYFPSFSSHVALFNFSLLLFWCLLLPTLFGYWPIIHQTL